MSNPLLVSLSVYGLAIIISMLVAVLIKGIVASLSLTRPKPEPVTLTTTPPPADRTQDDIAVIAAAVAATMGSHHVVHIEDAERGRVWTATGRASHYATHQIPRHRRH